MLKYDIAVLLNKAPKEGAYAANLSLFCCVQYDPVEGAPHCLGGRCMAFVQIEENAGICGMIPGALQIATEIVNARIKA